jgi:hypothetical protein
MIYKAFMADRQGLKEAIKDALKIVKKTNKSLFIMDDWQMHVFGVSALENAESLHKTEELKEAYNSEPGILYLGDEDPQENLWDKDAGYAEITRRGNFNIVGDFGNFTVDDLVDIKEEVINGI